MNKYTVESGITEVVHTGPLYLCNGCGSLIKVIKTETRTREECVGRESGHNGDNIFGSVTYRGFTCPQCNTFKTLSSRGGREHNQDWH